VSTISDSEGNKVAAGAAGIGRPMRRGRMRPYPLSLVGEEHRAVEVVASDGEPDAQTESAELVGRTWPWRRSIFALGILGVLVAADRVDRVAAGLTLVLLVSTLSVFKRRSGRATRQAGLVASICAALVGLLAAIALPVYALKQDPLIVNVPSEAAPSSAPNTEVLKIGAQDGTTVLGFAATDYDDTAAGLDENSRQLSIVAATGLTLGTSPGTVVEAPLQDSIVRAHIAGARAFAVVTNYDGNTFSPEPVRKLLNTDGAKDRFIAAMTTLVARENLDGVVLDFESLTAEMRDPFSALVEDLHRSLGRNATMVAVPGFTDPNDVDSRAYDLRRLGAASEGLVLMAYDEHDPLDAAGSIASLAWVNEVVKSSLAQVPANKLLLGVPTFGYVWYGGAARPTLPAEEITAKEGSALKDVSGKPLAYDPITGERHGKLTGGREAWFVDARGMRARAQIATSNGLQGVALWRIGSEEKGALASLPFQIKKETPVAPGRPIVTRHNTGVVALTFDDGPDGTWTPKILSILHEKHVPATFFVVAKQAEKHPELIFNILHSGSVVANHTYSHLDTASASQWRTKLDIIAGRAVIEGITGQTPLLFRAPYGAGDTTTGHKGADAIAADLGMHAIGWNVDPGDWRKPGANVIASNVSKQISERSIVLLHDGGGDRAQTVAALPAIIDQLREKGYVFTTIEGLDASLVGSYARRTDGWSRARGLLIIAGFRLQLAIRKLFLWIVVATALGAFARVLFAGPLAISHLLVGGRRRRRLAKIEGPMPTVTVLVPAFNEAQVIEKTLAALVVCQPLPTRVIVLDDGSTDATADIVRAFMATNDATYIELVVLQNGGKANALNIGTEMANTDVVLVIDADTMVDQHIIGELAQHFRDPHVGAVAGNVKVGNRRNVLAALQTLEYVIALNLDKRAQDMAHVMGVVPGAAGAFRRSALLAVGGYPPDTLVEDADLTQALLRQGWRIPYEPRAIAWTEAPQSLRDVVKQRRRWSFGTIQVVNKHKHAIFEPRAGALGFIGLPWMLMTQVALPVLGPFADFYLLYLVLIGAKSQALGILALAFIADLALAVVAVAMDRERPSIVLLAPLMRLVWRPLQLWIVVRSALRFVRGEDELWRKITRHNSVAEQPSRVPSVAA
jgi:peptidoglycan-N-acetylglucosamine deacetylase